MNRLACFLLLLVACPIFSSVIHSAELFEITPETRPDIGGKEVDWIDGDIVLRNENIVAVIANPIAGRDANMTVRNVGGGIIDLTRRDDMSDQLSAFYPTAGHFDFIDPTRVTSAIVDGVAYWECESRPNAGGITATVRYELSDDADSVRCSLKLRGKDAQAIADIPLADGVRADRTFRFSDLDLGTTDAAVFSDDFFGQAYGIVPVTPAAATVAWDDQRMRSVTYKPNSESSAPQEPTAGWTVEMYPAGSVTDLVGLIHDAAPQTFVVSQVVGSQPRVTLQIKSVEGHDKLNAILNQPIALASASKPGKPIHLIPGTYAIRCDAIGHDSTSTTLTVTDQPATHELALGQATSIAAKITDDNGQPIPAKLTFYGSNGTADPDFGPDSADGSVRNCVYTVDGAVVRSIAAGRYDVLISHGPEYDAETRTISLIQGQQATVEASLRRVIDTTGWVSCELHSHSSPSGDNTSSQLGRVENLVCEHIEFGPCTEHQRIESYDDQLQALRATHLMATCSGMELTGGPLPLNHQNVFPLKWRTFEQAGGGPRTDQDPISQIQRIAMWDNAADKVVQINHPDLHQMARDKDRDGNDDGGFASMFQFADVIEVHPPAAIFANPDELSPQDLRDNRILQWMRLIGEGTRIPGVVNTDAHYNHHGSGWLRNWVVSSTDDPADIRIEEMIDSLEAGRVIMSSGPFMTVQLTSDELDTPAQIGDTVVLQDEAVQLDVKIQCPNWLDVNRVEVFVNGRAVPELTRRRATHPDTFGNGVVKFDQQLPLTISENAFIIVAAIGEDQMLGRVMGEQFGKNPPVVVSNPIYVMTKKD